MFNIYSKKCEYLVPDAVQAPIFLYREGDIPNCFLKEVLKYRISFEMLYSHVSIRPEAFATLFIIFQVQ